MRFAFVLFLLATFVPVTIADDEKKPTAKETVVLSPEKQLEKAIAEYKKIVTDVRQFNLLVAAPARAKGIRLEGDPLMKLIVSMHDKEAEVIDLHKRLAIAPDPQLRKELRARRSEIELGIIARAKDKRTVSKEQTIEEEIELTMSAILLRLNAPKRTWTPGK